MIRVSVAADAADAGLVRSVVDIVNAAYVRGEQGMWLSNAARTSETEIQDLLSKGRLLLAFSAAEPAQVQGSVMCNVGPEDGMAELGMLAVAESELGKGIGRRLVEAVEARARSCGCSAVRLEILAPSVGEHPVKKWLGAWYVRLGYTVVSLAQPDEFARSYPQLAPLLAVECTFTIYTKSVGATVTETAASLVAADAANKTAAREPDPVLAPASMLPASTASSSSSTTTPTLGADAVP